MNHLERKLAKRAEKKMPTYQMTAAQLAKMKQDAYNEAYDKAWEDYNVRVEGLKKDAVNLACQAVVVVPLIVAHDKLGFGGIRLRRFLDYMMAWIKAIEEDSNTLIELQELVQEYTGIIFRLEEEVQNG